MSEEKPDEVPTRKYEAMSAARSRRKNPAVRVLDITSMLAAFVAATVISSAIPDLLYDVVADRVTGLYQSSNDHITTTPEFFMQMNDRLSSLEAVVSQSSAQAFSEAAAVKELNEYGARIASIEKTLDMQPRDIIELFRLRDEVDDLKTELKEGLDQALREVDRTFSLMLATIAALVVSVVAMAGASILRRGKQE